MYSMNDLESAKLIYVTELTDCAWTAPAIWTVNLFVMQDAKAHGVARRRLLSYYSMASIVQYEIYVDECVRTSAGNWRGSRRENTSWLFTRSPANHSVILKRQKISNMIARLDHSNLYSASAGSFPLVHAMLVRLVVSPAQLVIQRKTKTTITQDGDSEPPQSERRTEDFFGKFLAAHDRDHSPLTSTHLLFGCVQNIFAASDTTGIALSSMIFI
ncbi:Pisatin demethylase [Penicillium canescens]|uniref:Pisatin demethylase n=1 Tax=Penicillium canescens TaxID=5083 RepID=A0AAD6N2S0_PENCN|nr:Pisatin demethylase [Penicillium canescens]